LFDVNDGMDSQDNAAESQPLLLKTTNLSKHYGQREVVHNVSIHVRAGEVVGLLGPNGAGKTTTFYMITGLVRPSGGQVFFRGKEVTHMPIYRRARLGMGYLPQEESIFRNLTVEENLLTIYEFIPVSPKARREGCEELLELFGLKHLRKNIAMTLSGGEKRRLTIARTMVTSPSLILLDEPFSGVDPLAVADIQGIIEQLKKDGLGVLITDHNVRETLTVVDRAYLIYEGRVARHGTSDFLANDPQTRKLYLGEHFTM
jgi:lipopolysaccharide export system ATP-binding protein